MFEWTRPLGWATARGHCLWPGTDASPSISPCACGHPGLTTASGHCSSQQNSMSSGPLLSQRHHYPLLLPARIEAAPQQGLRGTLSLGTGGRGEQSEAICVPGRRGGLTACLFLCRLSPLWSLKCEEWRVRTGASSKVRSVSPPAFRLSQPRVHGHPLSRPSSLSGLHHAHLVQDHSFRSSPGCAGVDSPPSC